MYVAKSEEGRSSVWVVVTLNPWMASVFLFATSSRPGLIVWPKQLTDWPKKLHFFSFSDKPAPRRALKIPLTCRR